MKKTATPDELFNVKTFDISFDILFYVCMHKLGKGLYQVIANTPLCIPFFCVCLIIWFIWMPLYKDNGL